MFKVDNHSVCTTCKQKVADGNCLKCSKCDNLHHAVCSSAVDKDSQICNSTFLNYYLKPSTKPNFSWTCDVCKTEDESEELATLRQLINAMSKTHSEQIQALTNLVTDLTLKVDKMSEVKPPESKEATHRTNTVWDDVNRVQKLRVKASLVVKPDQHGNIIKTKTVKKIATEQGIPIDSVVESSNGETFVNTPDVESRDKVLQCLEASHASNPVVKLKSKLPTITVMDVEARHLMNEDDQVVTKNELRENIYRLNKFITPLVDTGSELEVVYMKAPPTGKNFYSVYIRVSPDIRLTIDKKMGNKIHFGAKVFNIKDRFHVKRCNRCQGLGHYAEKCDTEKNPVKCGYCAKDHDSNECPEKGRPHERHTCTNCSDANRDGSGHPAFWTKCPTYKEAQDKLKKTIPYYNLN